MKRLNHYVKENAGSETIHHCIFVDCETDPHELPDGYTGHKLRFGWACATRRSTNGGWTKDEWKRFTHLEEFWLWAMSHCYPKKKTWVWCHNSSFDYPVLDAFRHLIATGWTLESAIIDAPPTIVSYRCETRTLVLCDTLNIWRMSLVELGKRIGLPKLEMPGRWTDSEEDDKYCVRDVEIIKKSVCDWAGWLQRNDMGGFAPTIAAQSMRTFRHRFLRNNILIDDNYLTHTLARSCYHGGRCEAAFVGHLHQKIHSVDVNSMYPYVMSYAEMPLRLRGVSRFVQIHHLKKLLKDYCICAHVRLKTTEPFAAVVLNGKLCFPTGEFDAYLSTPELQYAIDIGALVEVKLCASYDKGVPFREFALELYNQKERASRAGNDIEARHWKLLLNSFYGKWGQSGRKWTEVGTCDDTLFKTERTIDAQTRKKVTKRYFGGLIYERADDGESRESHPAIAAHITAHARMILWALIREVPPQDYFYCDTDGLLVSENGLDVLHDRMDQHVLGKLKHVRSYTDITIYGCKDLILNGKRVCKGIRYQAKRLAKGKYRQIKWTGLRGLLANGNLNMPITSLVVKTLNRVYDKGVVGTNGFVTPLHLILPPDPDVVAASSGAK
jgi:hypothetical protein